MSVREKQGLRILVERLALTDRAISPQTLMFEAITWDRSDRTSGRPAPLLFAHLISSHNRSELFWGYLLGAALMLLGAATELKLGVKAERQSLESISTPLQASGQAG